MAARIEPSKHNERYPSCYRVIKKSSVTNELRKRGVFVSCAALCPSSQASAAAAGQAATKQASL